MAGPSESGDAPFGLWGGALGGSAVFWLVRAAVPHMPKDSAIINTASRNTCQSNHIFVDYAMTKVGIANMTHSLARQFLPRSIRVNVVAPGPFWTLLQVCGVQPQSVVQHCGEENALSPSRTARWRLHRSMSPWPLRRAATWPGRSGASLAVTA